MKIRMDKETKIRMLRITKEEFADQVRERNKGQSATDIKEMIEIRWKMYEKEILTADDEALDYWVVDAERLLDYFMTGWSGGAYIEIEPTPGTRTMPPEFDDEDEDDEDNEDEDEEDDQANAILEKIKKFERDAE